MNINKEMSHQEKVEMYNALPKETLIEIIIEANKVIDILAEPIKSYDVDELFNGPTEKE